MVPYIHSQHQRFNIILFRPFSIIHRSAASMINEILLEHYRHFRNDILKLFWLLFQQRPSIDRLSLQGSQLPRARRAATQ
jgi:hypothetical protein